MKHQTLFSSKDKSKKNKSVVCCNLPGSFKGYTQVQLFTHCFTAFPLGEWMHFQGKQLRSFSALLPLSKEVISYRKELTPLRADSFLLRVDFLLVGFNSLTTKEQKTNFRLQTFKKCLVQALS